MTYVAVLVVLDGVPKIRVKTDGGLLVGYFPVDATKITYHGREVDLADVKILPESA
jgi:hypothetical protein